MKDLGDTSFVLGSKYTEIALKVPLDYHKKSYIKKVLKRFGRQECKPGDTLVAKGDKFSLSQYYNNKFKVKEMKRILYASTVRSLMYAQVCKRLDIAYIVGMLDRYLSKPDMDH